MKEPSKNPIMDKSFAFAIRIVNLNRLLVENKEYVLSKQLLRAGTAVGALVREAQYGESRRDFAHKMAMAIKEANETAYWLDLLVETNWIGAIAHRSIKADCVELIRILTAIINTAKKNANAA